MQTIEKTQARYLYLLVLLLFNILSANNHAHASNYETSAYVEHGRRSTSEDFEEAASDDDYRYEKYNFKFKHQINDLLRYDFTSHVYDKDYEDREGLDNITRLVKNNWVNYLKKDKTESLKFDVKLKYKQKRYCSTPASEYNETQAQTGITYNRKENYKLSFFAGIKDTSYIAPTEKDQFSYFGKLGFDKYLLNKKLILINKAKIERTNREKNDRDRTKYDLTTGFDYNANQTLIKKIILRTNRARRNTKSEEDRDDDSDYEHWKHYIKTIHKLSNVLQTTVKYQYFKRDYIDTNDDNHGYYLQNTWRYDLIKESQKNFYTALSAKYKTVNYSLKSGYDYDVYSYDIKGVYDLKKNIKFTAALQTDIYDYVNPTNYKKEYYAKFGIEKHLMQNQLTAALNFKYKYTNYKENNNKSRETIRLSFKYKF